MLPYLFPTPDVVIHTQRARGSYARAQHILVDQDLAHKLLSAPPDTQELTVNVAKYSDPDVDAVVVFLRSQGYSCFVKREPRELTISW